MLSAWQWNKSAIKSKKVARTKHCTVNREFCLEIATGYLQEEFDSIKNHVFSQLDQTVQSSAMANGRVVFAIGIIYLFISFLKISRITLLN